MAKFSADLHFTHFSDSLTHLLHGENLLILVRFCAVGNTLSSVGIKDSSGTAFKPLSALQGLIPGNSAMLLLCSYSCFAPTSLHFSGPKLLFDVGQACRSCTITVSSMGCIYWNISLQIPLTSDAITAIKRLGSTDVISHAAFDSGSDC